MEMSCREPEEESYGSEEQRGSSLTKRLQIPLIIYIVSQRETNCQAASSSPCTSLSLTTLSLCGRHSGIMSNIKSPASANEEADNRSHRCGSGLRGWASASLWWTEATDFALFVPYLTSDKLDSVLGSPRLSWCIIQIHPLRKSWSWERSPIYKQSLENLINLTRTRGTRNS